MEMGGNEGQPPISTIEIWVIKLSIDLAGVSSQVYVTTDNVVSRFLTLNERENAMKPRMLCAMFAVAAIAVVLTLGAAAAQDQAVYPPATTYQAIDLTPAGFNGSCAYGVCGGQVVGYAYWGMQAINNGDALLWKGTAAHAAFLRYPPGFNSSRAYGTDGKHQVGCASNFISGPGGYVFYSHAMLWKGRAAHPVDLHPTGFESSWAYGVDGGQQVGCAYGSATGVNTHALLWTGSAESVIDLNPPGFEGSCANGVAGGQQVGGVYTGGQTYAVLWTGSADSAVDLHAAGFANSEALGVSGGQQVGYGAYSYWDRHALLWTGSAASVVDLHPAGFTRSCANGVGGGQQVGYGIHSDGTLHALLWTGSADSVLDLNAFLPTGFTSAVATGIDAAGNIVGYASGPPSYGDDHAILWQAK
jgi:hypothetical protein